MRTPRPEGWPRVMREWEGRRVEARRAIQNRGGDAVKAGARGTIESAHRGVRVSFDVCEHCGTQLYVSGVDPRDLTLLPPETET